LDLLKGLKHKKTNENIKTYTMESPDDGFSPLGTEIKTNIDLNKPKTLQECTAASPKWFAPERASWNTSVMLSSSCPRC
jgi:hypothetical protein